MENETKQPEIVAVKETENTGQDNPENELLISREKIAGLEKALREKETEIAAVKQTLDEAKQAIVETAVDLSQAVSAYKELVGQANPGLVAEMLKGDTIAEINTSLKSARELVDKIKREVGADNARVRVPAGAPPRVQADLSVLTAREKIKFAVEGR